MKGIIRLGIALVAVLALPALGAERDCYIGIVGGGAIGPSRHNSATNGPITDHFDISGPALGASAGCLWRANRNGYGLEGDLSALRAKGSGPDKLDPGFSSETRVERLAMLRVVLGYETRPNWFAYGTAGIATAVGRIAACAPGGTCASDDKRLWGLAAGLGAEYAMSQSLRLRFEYLYVGFAKKKFLDPAPAPFSERGGGVEAELHLFRMGLMLHF